MMSFMTKCSMNRFVKGESVQCNAAFVMTGAIRGANIEKLFQELRLESLQNRRKM